jgi:hypothetical protein
VSAIVVRSATEADEYFIHTIYYEQQRAAFERSVHGEVLQAFLPLVVDATIARADCRVAVFESVPDEVLSLVVDEPHPDGDILHLCYTKAPYRRQGLFTALSKGRKYRWHTMQTRMFRQALLPSLHSWFNPFLLPAVSVSD